MSPTAETFGQLFDGILSFFNKNFSDSIVFYNFVANVLGYLRQSFFKPVVPVIMEKLFLDVVGEYLGLEQLSFRLIH